MTKQEHIAYWIRTAEEDWTVVDILFEKSKYLYCLFYAHLAVEKILKAHWVKNCDGNYPPPTSDLVKLTKLANIELNEAKMSLLPLLTDIQEDVMNPDFSSNIEQLVTKDYTFDLLPKAKELYKNLKEMIK